MPLLLFLGALRPDILRNLLSSQAFGWSIFSCPLSQRSFQQLAAAGLISNVLHDLPQLCVSISLINTQDPQSRHYQVVALMAVCSIVALLYSIFSF